MPIFTALSTFDKKPLEKPGKCTVCKKKHEAGTKVLWKSYRGKFGICRVILCNEDCHQTYDFVFWSTDQKDKNKRGLR